MSQKKPQPRPDELVIPKDVMRALPKGLTERLFGKDKVKAERVLIPLISNARNMFKEYLEYETHLKYVPNIDEHQWATDKVIALAVLQKAIPEADRNRLLAELILNAVQTNRGSYQFIREFLRINLAPMMHQRSISLCEAPELYPPNIRQFYEVDGQANCASKAINIAIPLATTGFLIGMAKGIGSAIGEDIQKSLKEITNLLWQFFCQKGEFTHFYEVFPALKAINEADRAAAIAIAVGRKERFKEIDKHIRKHSPGIHRKCLPNTKAFRYYILPDQYLVLMGGSGQFVTFRGYTVQVSDSITNLIGIDFGDGSRDVAVSE